MVVKAIGLSFEAYMFLQEECHRQRSETGKPLSARAIEGLINTFDNFKNKDGLKLYSDGDLGGCNGDPLHAWEERRWTSWSVEDVKKMLDKKGLYYKEGYTREFCYA